MENVYDAQGVVVAVQLPVNEYDELMDTSDELEDTERFYAAVQSRDERIPFRRRTERQSSDDEHGGMVHK